jgi:hypothetical protein
LDIDAIDRRGMTMITFVRTAVAMPGKLGDLVPIAKEIGAISKRVNSRELTVGMAFGGNGSEVAWIVQYDSLAQSEEFLTRLMADAEYRALLKQIETLLVPGSLRDQIWRHV